MTDKKLEALFSELTDEEIKTLEESGVDMNCELDDMTARRISDKVRAKTGEITICKPKHKKKGKWKIALIAAAIIMIFAISTGAVYKFSVSDGLKNAMNLESIERIKTVVDVDSADEDSVKTVQKTVSKNGYTVTFEAIVEGCMIRPDYAALFKGQNDAGEIEEDKIYAIMTITRDDGKSVLAPDGDIPTCFCCDYFFDFCVAVNGYAPNVTMFTGTPCYYEENNLLYFACDITDAAKFADRKLSIIVFNDMTYDGTVVRMDENGDYYFVDTYDDIGAIFDFDLDDSLADPEAVAKDMAERPYIYVTDPDYTEADELIAKDEALKKVDLSYAIGNHRWYGWDAMQFGDIPYAETFIELFAKKSELSKTDIDALNEFIDEESARLDTALTAEVERLSGKDFNLVTVAELNEIEDEIDAFTKENSKIKADSLRENFNFVKLEDGSEYCYIDEFTFLYIPAGSEYAKIVVVYGDRIVISIECTVDNLCNHSIAQLLLDENTMPGSMDAYWYLFGVDEDSRFAKLYDEEDYKAYSESIESEQDAIFSLLSEFRYYEGTAEVIRMNDNL